MLKSRLKCKKIISANTPIERFELSRAEAIKLMKKYKEKYKVELINDLPDEEIISFYKQGSFTELVQGPSSAFYRKNKGV